MEQTKEVTQTADLLPKEYVSQIPALITAMNTTLAGAQAKVASFPAVTNDDEKADAFALREKIRLAMEDYKGRRMPFTRALDQITAVFTTAEKGYQALLDTIDGKTKAYATQQLEEARKKKAEADRQLREKERAITRAANIKLDLERKVSGFLDAVRAAAGKVVAEVTKATLKECQDRLSVDPKWTPKMEAAYYTVSPEWAGNQEEIDAYSEIAKAEYDRLKLHYNTRGKILLADSKSLLEVAVTNKDEAARMQTSLTTAHKKEETKAHEEIVANKEADLAFATMDHAAPPPPAVKIKQKIEVVSNDGWLQIMAFWYANDPEAKTMDLSKTLSKFKTFAEKKVNFDDTRIVHPAIRYVEDVTAKKG